MLFVQVPAGAKAGDKVSYGVRGNRGTFHFTLPSDMTTTTEKTTFEMQIFLDHDFAADPVHVVNVRVNGVGGQEAPVTLD